MPFLKCPSPPPEKLFLVRKIVQDQHYRMQWVAIWPLLRSVYWSWFAWHVIHMWTGSVVCCCLCFYTNASIVHFFLCCLIVFVEYAWREVRFSLCSFLPCTYSTFLYYGDRRLLGGRKQRSFISFVMMFLSRWRDSAACFLLPLTKSSTNPSAFSM